MNFIKITEQPSIHEDLEQKSVRELLEGINEEDRKVASAVHACIPQIEKLVNEIVERMHQGGRIFYLGAGTSGRLGVLDASEIPPTFGRPYGSERFPYPCNLAMNFLRSTIKRRCSPSPMVPVSSSATTLKVSLRPSIPVSTAVAVMVLPKAVGLR